MSEKPITELLDDIDKRLHRYNTEWRFGDPKCVPATYPEAVRLVRELRQRIERERWATQKWQERIAHCESMAQEVISEVSKAAYRSEADTIRSILKSFQQPVTTEAEESK